MIDDSSSIPAADPLWQSAVLSLYIAAAASLLAALVAIPLA